jgi:hypothetical protein
MKRSARLQSASPWLKQYQGRNILRGYCKHFGVDWRCAAVELKQLGVQLDPEYLKQREMSERQLANNQKRRRHARIGEDGSDRWYDYDSPWAAYLAEDYAALFAMECELNLHATGEPNE